MGNLHAVEGFAEDSSANDARLLEERNREVPKSLAHSYSIADPRDDGAGSVGIAEVEVGAKVSPM